MADCRLWMLYLTALLLIESHYGVRIDDCDNGSVDIVEDTSCTFSCSAWQREELSWRLYDKNRDAYHDLGSCDTENCTSVNSQNNLRVEASSFSYRSVLTISKVQRDTGDELICVTHKGHASMMTMCNLRIIAPARIVPGNCSVTISNWEVHGSCQVERMYASDNIYNCTWRVNKNEINSSFQSLTHYDWLENRTYWRGVCSFRKIMSLMQLRFSYSIVINPGPSDVFVDAISIIRPGEPKYSCPKTVFEGSNVNCTCFSSNMGNPPAKLVWDGKNSDILLLHDVLRESSSMNYTCRLTWGGIGGLNRQVVYTLNVVAPARIVPGNCTVTISNWRVQGSCQVENMYMSSDSYICEWRISNARIGGGFEDHREYYRSLFRIYWKTVCSFSGLLPVDQKKLTYSIEIDPGSQYFFVKTINITHPQKPEHNCPDTVVVGSNVSCTCISLNMGNPPANLVWDGKTDGILLLQDVQRENDNTSYTCRLTWGPNGFINQTTVYTLRVVEKQISAGKVKGGIVGGFGASVGVIAVIGSILAVYTVKCRKGPGYMNVSEVPTYSSVNVYHTVSWTVMSTQTQPPEGGDVSSDNESQIHEEQREGDAGVANLEVLG